MKSGLFTNFRMSEENEKKRSKSISSLKSIKLKKIKPNPNINNISNLSRIYNQDNSTLTRSIIDSFSPSLADAHIINSVGKMFSNKKSNSKQFISAKSDFSLKKNVYKKRNPLASLRTKQDNQKNPIIHVEESLSTTVNSNINTAKVNNRQKVSRFLSASTLEKGSKDVSYISYESSEFKARVTGLFEKFKSEHYGILKKFRC